jgi:hypothetical protein
MGMMGGDAKTVKGTGFDTTVGKMKDMGYSKDQIGALNPQLNPYQKLGKGMLGGLGKGMSQYGQDPNQNFFGGM